MVSPKPICTGPLHTWSNRLQTPSTSNPATAKTDAWIGLRSATLVIPSNGVDALTRNRRSDMNISKRHLLLLTGLLLAVTALGFGIRTVLAQPEATPALQPSSLHPTFALLDVEGKNVLDTGNPVSTMKTCGQCHNTEYIQQHAFHSDLGLSDYKENGELDSSTGTFGKWDPLTYRFLSQSGDERLDLSTAEWLEKYGYRVVGGGP